MLTPHCPASLGSSRPPAVGLSRVISSRVCEPTGQKSKHCSVVSFGPEREARGNRSQFSDAVVLTGVALDLGLPKFNSAEPILVRTADLRHFHQLRFRLSWCSAPAQLLKPNRRPDFLFLLTTRTAAGLPAEHEQPEWLAQWFLGPAHKPGPSIG